MCCGLCGCCGACAACSACCCSNLQDCNVKRGAASRIPYIFIMFIFCIFAVFMSLYGEKVLYSNHVLNFSLSICNSSSCTGNGSVYRTSFSLFAFFIIHAFLICFIKSFNWSFFGFKLLFLIGFLTITFWIPNSFFDGYASFSRVASIIFLIFQLMVLISWAWDINDRIVGKINQLQEELSTNHNNVENEKNVKLKIKIFQTLLILITLILIGAIIALLIYMFNNFDKKSCSFNEAMMSITIVLVFIALCLPPILQSSSIFTSAVVGFYMTYLCYTGLSSFPKKQCNPFANDRNTLNLWIGIVITVAAISYIGCGVSKHNVLFPNEYKKNQHESEKENEDNIELQVSKSQKQKIGENGTGEENEIITNDDTKKTNENDDDCEGQASSNESEVCKDKLEQKANVLFHFCMAFSAIYMSMLFTNWGTNVMSSKQAIIRGKISLWVNIASQWMAFILYVWTVLAPKICPQRFGIENVD